MGENMRSRTLTSLGVVGASVALALSGIIAGSSAASAQENPYQRGPEPTASSVRDRSGPFQTRSASATGASGFGGGTVYYPTDTSEGTFGGVVVAPGFTAGSSTYSGYAQRLASHGFVVLAMDTNTRMDFPDQRGDQMEAALDWLVESSPAADVVDPERLAVSGHSMGGGGTLAAANARPELEAAVPLQPWHSTKNWSGIEVPTMIIGAQNDTIAATSSHAEPFYESLSDSIEKAYVELAGDSHMAAALNPDDQGAAAVAWLKRYVDNDARYEQFLCPAPSSSDYSAWEDSCPGEDEGGGGTPPTTDPGTPPTTVPEDECSWWEWWC
jgi:dienelactone hydrolase